MTSSARSMGTSTRLKRSAISIAPISRPWSFVSPVIAPTRSWGRTCAARPRPMKIRAVSPAAVAAWATGGVVLLVPVQGHLRDVRLGVLVAADGRRLVGELDRGQRDVQRVELVRERVEDDAKRLEIVLQQRLVQRGASELQPASLEIGDGRDGLDHDRLLGEPLDRLQHPVLARLGQRDRRALTAGTTDSSDPVDVGLGRGRHVEVHDVRERLDVEAAGGDIGGDEQVGGLRPSTGRAPWCAAPG